MAKGPAWSKELAAEIVKAGFRALTHKYHPDKGGSHEAMISLQATREKLEELVAGRTGADAKDDPLGGRQREYTKDKRWDDFREQYDKWQRWKNDSHTDNTHEIPLKPYAQGWYCVEDTVAIQLSATGKAIQVLFPGVDDPFWLPVSQMHKNANKVREQGNRGLCVFSAWIARQKGWI
jgi:hypothetical protein